MPDGGMTEPQLKFFERYINQSLALNARQQTNEAFEDAFADYLVADANAVAALAALPNYPKGTPEFDEKAALFTRYQAIQTETLKAQNDAAAATKACEAAKASLNTLAADAKSLLTKALTDNGMSDAARIVLLKQMAQIEIAGILAAFDAEVEPTLKELGGKGGPTSVLLPVKTEMNAAIAALREEVVRVSDSGQTVDAAKATLDAITAKAGAAKDKHLAALAAFRDSAGFAIALEFTKQDQAIRSALVVAKANATDMEAWDVPDAAAFGAETKAFEARAMQLFAKSVATDEAEADAAKAARTTLQAEIEALNERSAKAIMAKKMAFGQVFRDVEQRFAAVERSFREIDDSAFVKGQVGPILDFLSKTRTAINDLGGYNTDALQAAKKLVDEAAVIVMAAQRAAQTNALIKETLKTIGIAISYGARNGVALDAKFQAYKEEHAALEKNWTSMLPNEAKEKVRSFIAKVTADIELSKQIDARRRAALAELAIAKKDLNAFNLAYAKMLKAYDRKAKPYEGEVTRDLAQVEAWIPTKTTLAFFDTIDAMLGRCRAEIGRLFTGLQANEGKSDDQIFDEARALAQQLDDIARETMEQALAQGKTVDLAAIKNARAAVDAQVAQLSVRSDLLGEDNAAERRRAEEAAQKETYLNDAAAFLKSTKEEIKAAEPASALAHYKDEVTAQLNRVENTVKLVGKGGPVAAAISELEFVTKLIETIKARGPRTNPKELAEIGKEWAKAVGDFTARKDAFLAKVKPVADAHGAGPSYTALAGALDKIVARLDSSGFDAAAAEFADPSKTKSAREKALQKVRYYNDLLLKDPVIQQCVLNPFGEAGFASAIASRLRQIELNVLRSV
jgi:hypothetical protein